MKNLFSGFLDATQILEDSTLISQYMADRTKHYKSLAKLVLLPQNVDELCRIASICYNNSLLMIPLGGRTGLSAATVGTGDEVGIAMDKMNKIIEIDEIGYTVECEAGVILENLQQAVSERGMLFPLDYAAKGSCQIGGSVSTNAGGINVLKYGMTRDLVLGLEIVLADGKILNLNHALIKDNSAYKLMQLFIGAEGTLGFISKVTLKCYPQVKNRQIVYFGVKNFEFVPQILQELRQRSFDIIAFECLSKVCHDAVLESMPQLRSPFQSIHHYYILCELDEKNSDAISEVCSELMESDIIQDAVIAQNDKEATLFKLLREAVSDALYLKGEVHANDISVPVSSLKLFLNDLNNLFRNSYSKYLLGVFGHIGDGNLHIYIINSNNESGEIFKNACLKSDHEIFALIEQYRGSISAEHGIGLLKKSALRYRRSETEIELMRNIKQLFDPKNLMNPGKIFTVEISPND
jgi:FAD/FMN-containing dehydrogenase